MMKIVILLCLRDCFCAYRLFSEALKPTLKILFVRLQKYSMYIYLLLSVIQA